MKRNRTKKSLLLSVMSLLLCVSMFAGSTYAWFTDEVTSGVNQIIAGNLDVELKHKNNTVTTYESVEGQTDLFKNALGNTILWEPGAMAYETFEVSNVGTLALKYKLNLTDAGHNFVVEAGQTTPTTRSLLDVIKVAVLDNAPTSRETLAADTSVTWTTLANFISSTSSTGTLYPTGATVASSGADEAIGNKSFTVVLYWQPGTNDFDNLYNLKNGAYASDSNATDVGQLYANLGVTLVATQVPHEEDSFDNQYDASALLPVTESVSTSPITSNTTTDIIVNGTGDLESVTMSKESVNTVFDSLASSSDPGASYSLTLTPSLTKNNENTSFSGSTGTTTVDLDLSMSATMVTTTTTGSSVETSDVHNLGGYVTYTYNLGTGLDNVVVKHNGNAMVDSLDVGDDAGNGIYHYDSTSGILTIKVDSLSPFTVSYDGEYVARIDNVGYESLQAAFTAANNGDVITLLTNTSVNSPIILKEDTTYTLNLEGYNVYANTASARPFVLNQGTILNVNATTGGVSIPEDNAAGAYGLFRIQGASAELHVNGGNYGGSTANVESTALFWIGNNALGVTLELNNINVITDGVVVRDGVSWYADYYGVEEYRNVVKVHGGNYQVNNLGINVNGSITGFVLQGDSSEFKDVKITSTIGSCIELDYGNAIFTNNTFTVLNENAIQSWNGTTIGISYNAEATINSGTYSSEAYGISTFSRGGKWNINGGTIAGNSAAIKTYYQDGDYSVIITGGELNGQLDFEQHTTGSITGGTFSVDPSAYVANGYYANDNKDGTWTVSILVVGPVSGEPLVEGEEN